MSPFSDMNTAMSEKSDLVWRALSEPLRREILDGLIPGPMTTGEIVAKFDGLSRTGVMKHLDVLVEAELVIVQKTGRTRWNHLNPVPIERVCQRWLNRHTKRMASALLRLKSTVEEPTSSREKDAKPRP